MPGRRPIERCAEPIGSTGSNTCGDFMTSAKTRAPSGRLARVAAGAALLCVLALVPGCSALDKLGATVDEEGRPVAVNCSRWIQAVEVQDAAGTTLWTTQRTVTGTKGLKGYDEKVVVGMAPEGWRSDGVAPSNLTQGRLIVTTGGTDPPTATTYEIATLSPGRYVVDGQSVSASSWRDACEDFFWGIPGWVQVAIPTAALAAVLLLGLLIVRYAGRPLFRPPPPAAPTVP